MYLTNTKLKIGDKSKLRGRLVVEDKWANSGNLVKTSIMVTMVGVLCASTFMLNKLNVAGV